MPLKIPYYEMDIPRLVTALADWLACLLYLRFLPPRYGGVKRAALYGGKIFFKVLIFRHFAFLSGVFQMLLPSTFLMTYKFASWMSWHCFYFFRILIIIMVIHCINISIVSNHQVPLWINHSTFGFNFNKWREYINRNCNFSFSNRKSIVVFYFKRF